MFTKPCHEVVILLYLTLFYDNMPDHCRCYVWGIVTVHAATWRAVGVNVRHTDGRRCEIMLHAVDL
jgi:hypothetical protein